MNPSPSEAIGPAESGIPGLPSAVPPHSSGAAPHRRLILGLGNEILTDDAIGFHVAAALQTGFAGIAGTVVSSSDEVGLGLLDILCDYDEVVLIDAIQTGTAEIGYVHEVSSEQLKAMTGVGPHFMGIAEMLALGRELGLDVPGRLRIFAIEVEDPYTMGSCLTSSLQRVMPNVMATLVAKLSANA